MQAAGTHPDDFDASKVAQATRQIAEGTLVDVSKLDDAVGRMIDDARNPHCRCGSPFVVSGDRHICSDYQNCPYQPLAACCGG